MKIRNELKNTDIGNIILMHGELYSLEHGYDFTFEAYVAEPLAQFALRNNKREKIWIAEDDNGKIIGLICICEASDYSAQLRWFLVSPKARGQGLGKFLLNEALVFCDECDYKKIVLWTAKGLDTAKHLYLSNGFDLTEEKTHQIWGSVQTELCYEKNL